ncbi:hypothetical protein Aglo01_05140 [Actinokineospora globicatena]|uniref:Uncharacterized protein n=1 Tax=Actinokineospora globicatena TaxID=103729 RepID=A0A9W6QKT6_9PSEU|nr:hypothetical protein Aglo01_05140 [Actinokineospora globicatena]GLW91871.1 hypothetical protein Aglo03_26870 [Actinokineospora globicatena]
MTLLAVPVSAWPATSAGRSTPAPYPELDAPAYTPVALPRNESGAIPARSRASQLASSNKRCCGSIASASRGEIPNSPASNVVALSTNPPALA